jgi:hypothetical protein
MPKLVSELIQGNQFARSSDGGATADTSTRKWKVLLNTPDEALDVFEVTKVNIGDLYSATNPIPCVSVEGSHDGDSRMVVIITATYRSSPGAAANAPDPKSQEPTVRPAMYSMTTSLTEIAAWAWQPVTSGNTGSWEAACNPVGDMYDGVTRLEPVVAINIEQYSESDQSSMLQYTGYVNSDTFTFSALSILPHGCMLNSVASNPVVEQFGKTTFRGFKVSFTFTVRAHWTLCNGTFQPIGWCMAVPQTGFNIINTGLGRGDVDQEALSLQHKLGKVEQPPAYAENTQGKKMRGCVGISAYEDGGMCQRPAAQPLALNNDGSPRGRNFPNQTKVIINRVCCQPVTAFGNNFSNFGIRWFA